MSDILNQKRAGWPTKCEKMAAVWLCHPEGIYGLAIVDEMRKTKRLIIRQWIMRREIPVAF